jgi:hypothetical protein
VPVCVGPRWAALAARDQSGRQFVLKRYTYEVFPAEPHPDFRERLCVRRPHLWLAPHLALAERYRPLSDNSLMLVARLMGEGHLPWQRRQRTSTLLVRRRQDGRRHFLLRWNEPWGYTLPARRRAADDPAPAAAECVARRELGLEPGLDVSLAPAPVPLVSTFAVSRTEGPPAGGAPTDYEHALFNAVLRRPVRLRSAAPLVWVSEEEILAGSTDARCPAADCPAPKPGPISATVRQILTGSGYCSWLDGSLFLP